MQAIALPCPFRLDPDIVSGPESENTMSTTKTLVPSATLDELTAWAKDTDKHGETLKALRSAKSADEFLKALPIARTVLHDTESAAAAVAVAKATAKVGQAVVDANTTFRMNLVAQYLRWFPKSTNRDIARALWDAPEGDAQTALARFDKMVKRDRDALTVRAAAIAAQKEAPEGSSISVPTPSAALKMVKHATVKEVKAMTDRASKGEPIVPDDSTPTPVKFGSIVSAAARLVDALGNVDPETITPDGIAALYGSLAKAATLTRELKGAPVPAA